MSLAFLLDIGRMNSSVSSDCVKICDQCAPSFLITSQRVNQRTKRREIIRAEQGSTRRHTLEVVHHPAVRPGPRQTTQYLGIDHAAHHRHAAHVQVGVNS